MDKQRIYILKSTFQEQKKRELAMLLLEAGYGYIQIGSEPVPGKAKARRPFIEFGTDPRDTEDKP